MRNLLAVTVYLWSNLDKCLIKPKRFHIKHVFKPILNKAVCSSKWSLKSLFFLPFSEFSAANFWNWTHFKDYVQFIIVFILFGSILTFTLSNFPVYLETLGFLSVFTEAMLGSPQFYRNYQNKSTTGMRFVISV